MSLMIVFAVWMSATVPPGLVEWTLGALVAAIGALLVGQRTGFWRLLISGNEFVKRGEMETKLEHHKEVIQGELRGIRQRLDASAAAREEMREDLAGVRKDLQVGAVTMGRLEGKLDSIADTVRMRK